MNKSNLLEILSNNKPTESYDAAWLKQVITTYPYFTGAAYALTKYYQQNQDFQFQQQLKITATLSADRKSLYKFVNLANSNVVDPVINVVSENKLIADVPNVELEKASNTESEIEVVEPTNGNATAEKLAVELVPEIISQEIVIEQTQLVKEEVSNDEIIENIVLDELDIQQNESDPITIASVNVSEHQISEVPDNAELPEFETAVQTSDYRAVEHITLNKKIEYHESDDIELSHDEVEQQNEKSAQNNVNVTEFLLGKEAVDVQKLDNKKENEPILSSSQDIEKTIPFNDIKTAVETAPTEHNVDMNIIANAIEKTLNVQEMTSAKSMLSPSPDEVFSFTDWLKQRTYQEKEQKVEESMIDNSTREPLTPIQIVEKAKADEILEKFIETQPRISKPKAEFYSPINMARQSVADTDELATETLATIYMAQGNYVKAIKVYEALMAKNTDRKPYFTALIKKAKDRILTKKS